MKVHLSTLLTALFTALFISASAGSAAAQPAPPRTYTPIMTEVQDLQLVEQGIVGEILKSDIIQLENRKSYALDGIRIPPYYSPSAAEYLKLRLVGKSVSLYANPSLRDGKRDRQGNQMVFVVIDSDNKLLQEEMIAEGMGWAYSTITNRDLALPLLKVEQKARDEGLGLWANPDYHVRFNDTVMNENNNFIVFEGKIKRVSFKKETIFLNFADDHERDFTIRLPRENTNLFFGRNSLYPDAPRLEDYEGAIIRIRGWVTEQNGPMIELTHPEQWEVLKFADPAPAESAVPAVPVVPAAPVTP